MKAKKMIKYLNGKSSTEPRTLDIRDIARVIMEISKMNERNLLHIQYENILKEVQKSMSLFDSKFDQRTRYGLPSCWE